MFLQKLGKKYDSKIVQVFNFEILSLISLGRKIISDRIKYEVINLYLIWAKKFR